MSPKGRLKGPGASGRRHIADPQPVDYNREKPVFCLQNLSPGRALDQCTEEQRAKFAEAIAIRSKLTWNELIQRDRHQLGSEKIDARQLPVPPVPLTDEVTFLAFRFADLAPMVGYRTQNVFHVLWLDHDMTLYDHGAH